MVTSLTLDNALSRLSLETRAKGMLSKLAHDLSILAGDLTSSASIDDGTLTLELRVRVADLRVEGVLKSNSVDKNVLSPSDRRDIERKIREEVLTTSEVVVTVRCPAPANLLETGAHEIATSLSVERGSARAETRTRATIQVDAGHAVAKGRATVTLSSLRIAPVKGPLNAFRVDDNVDVVYALRFALPTT